MYLANKKIRLCHTILRVYINCLGFGKSSAISISGLKIIHYISNIYLHEI